jgi:hypothetical protein
MSERQEGEEEGAEGERGGIHCGGGSVTASSPLCTRAFYTVNLMLGCRRYTLDAWKEGAHWCQRSSDTVTKVAVRLRPKESGNAFRRISGEIEQF